VTHAGRRLVVVHTGGTITSRGLDRLDLMQYVESGTFLDPEELMGLVPELGAVASLHHIIPPRRPSHAWSPDDWVDLARTLTAHLQEDSADGVVVLTGTNTLEELAFFLDVVMRSPVPVVVTGAMRPASALSSDGPLNLYRSALVALEPRSVGRGVLIVANEMIYSARDVTKAATYNVDAFRARQFGPLGWVEPDHRVRYGRQLEPAEYKRRTMPLDRPGPLPPVEIVASYAGADTAMIDAAVAAGARALVVAATGSGYPTPAQLDALVRAEAAGVVVCISTRTGSGPMVMTAFRERSGFIVSGMYSPWQARLLLMIGIWGGDSADQLREMLTEP
jgi:L-asparaginase